MKPIFGVDESKIDEVLESFKKSEAQREEVKKEKEKTWKGVLKYFLHGFAFSVLLIILFLAWTFGFVVLVLLGSFIGLIIGLGLLMLVVGFVNCILTSWMWFPVKSGLWDILFHGIALSAILLIADVILSVPYFIFPGIATAIITRVVLGSFIYGFIGKKVAGWWRTEREEIPKALEEELLDRKL